MESPFLVCQCRLALQPVKWSHERIIWCCSKICLPEALRFKKQLESENTDHCTKVVEFLNNNQKSPSWHWFNDRLNASCFSLIKLCQSKLSNPITFPYQKLLEMVQCLNSYDPNMEDDYTLGTKKRKQIQASAAAPPAKRKKTIHKRKLDPVALNGQLELFQFTSITFTKNQSDTLKRNNEIREKERNAWIKEHCRQCKCFDVRLVQKRFVQPFDNQGNVKKNAGRAYWACNECRYFLWEEDDDEVYNLYVNRTLRK